MEDGFEGEAELAGGEVVGEDLEMFYVSMEGVGEMNRATHVKEGADVEREMFGCHVSALGGSEDGEDDAVCGLEDFEEIVVAS